MPIITDIKRQKRAQTRYSIYLDGVYSFALTDLELSMSGLRVDRELTSAEVEEYQENAEQSKAYALAVRFLGIRPRSRREITDYLRRKEYLPSDIDLALNRLEELGLVNDQQFAMSWVANRQLLRPRSRRMLEQELLAKGVSRDDMAQAFSELDAGDELDSLVDVISKKRKLPQYQNAEKLMGFLARQGYTYDLIKKALARLEDGTD